MKLNWSFPHQTSAASKVKQRQISVRSRMFDEEPRGETAATKSFFFISIDPFFLRVPSGVSIRAFLASAG